MKTIETKLGNIFEIYETKAEIVHMIRDCYIQNKDVANDCALYVLYEDGSVYSNFGGQIEGTWKRTHIKTVIENNPSTCAVYGDYKLCNIDNIDEEYSEENDAEDKFWIAD